MDIFSLGIVFFELFFDTRFYDTLMDGRKSIPIFLNTEEDLQGKINCLLQTLLDNSKYANSVDGNLVDELQNQIIKDIDTVYDPMAASLEKKIGLKSLSVKDIVFCMLAMLQVICL